MFVRSAAVLWTPFVIASSATISATPSPTPIAVKIVRAGRRRRFFQISEGQVTARELSQCWASASFRALAVVGPTTPSAVRPFAVWKFITACVVAGPKLPSTVSDAVPTAFRACCRAFTAAPVSPCFKGPEAGTVTLFELDFGVVVPDGVVFAGVVDGGVVTAG